MAALRDPQATKHSCLTTSSPGGEGLVPSRTKLFELTIPPFLDGPLPYTS